MVITSEDYKGGDGSSHNEGEEGAAEPGDHSSWTTAPVAVFVEDTSTPGRKAKFDSGVPGPADHIQAESAGDHLTSVEMLQNNALSNHNMSSGEQIDNKAAERRDGEATKAEAPRVPDGGYGWFVVLGSFLSHILMGGLERSDGVFFLLFKSRFGKSAALTAWPGALASMIRLGMGPIASALCQRWSVRACVMLGALSLGIVQIMLAFSSNFYTVFVLHGPLQGICRGLLYCPSLVIVNMYFDRRLGFATGLSASGVGVGTLVMVPLIQLLFEIYGFQGGYLVISAICFNGLFMAMLYRPLFLHYKFTGHKGYSLEKPDPSDALVLSELSEAGDTTSLRSVHFRSTISINRESEAVHETAQRLLPPKLSGRPSSKDHVKNNSSHHIASTPRVVKKSSCLKSTLEILFPIEPVHKKHEDGKKKKLFHFGLLRNPPFLCFCLSICLFTAAFKSTFTFMPALAKSRGLTEKEGVAVLSISGIVDTFGRIMSGFVMDSALLRPWRLAVYSGVMFGIAGVCALMPILGASFVWLCVTCSAFGFMTGVMVSQKSVLCVDLLGAELMPSAFGLLLLFQAIGIGVGPILTGAFRDAFGRFHEAFFLGAGLMGIGACFMVLSTVLHKTGRYLKKEQKSTVL